MRYIVRSECRTGRVICAVSWPMRFIEIDEPCWHEPVRNWYAVLEKGEKLDAWVGVIEEALRTKQTVREVAMRTPGAWKIAPEPPLETREVIDIKTKPRPPVQGTLF